MTQREPDQDPGRDKPGGDPTEIPDPTPDTPRVPRSTVYDEPPPQPRSGGPMRGTAKPATGHTGYGDRGQHDYEAKDDEPSRDDGADAAGDRPRQPSGK